MQFFGGVWGGGFGAKITTKITVKGDKVRETKEALKEKGYDIPLVTGAGDFIGEDDNLKKNSGISTMY
jgi:hypothetical protein